MNRDPEASLRQCARGKHSYDYDDRMAQKRYVNCQRCGARVRRRARKGLWADKYEYPKHEIH